MISNKKIVIVNGTSEKDILQFADCAVRASENVIYHSMLDDARHIAYMANVNYPSNNSDKDQKLIDDLISAFNEYCDLSLERFIELLSGFFLIDELDHAFIYAKYPELEKKFIEYAKEKGYTICTLFIESEEENSSCLSNKSLFNTIITNNGSLEDLMNETIKYICGK